MYKVILSTSEVDCDDNVSTDTITHNFDSLKSVNEMIAMCDAFASRGNYPNSFGDMLVEPFSFGKLLTNWIKLNKISTEMSKLLFGYEIKTLERYFAQPESVTINGTDLYNFLQSFQKRIKSELETLLGTCNINTAMYGIGIIYVRFINKIVVLKDGSSEKTVITYNENGSKTVELLDTESKVPKDKPKCTNSYFVKWGVTYLDEVYSLFVETDQVINENIIHQAILDQVKDCIVFKNLDCKTKVVINSITKLN